MTDVRPLMLLNKTALSANHAFVLEASDGDKSLTLPPELCIAVSDLALEPRADPVYTLVRLREKPITTLESGRQVVLCDEYKTNDLAQHVDEDKWYLEEFLEDPDIFEDDEDFRRRCGFHMPTPTGNTYTIPIALLDRSSKGVILHTDVTPADIISCMENGKCRSCGGDRSLDTGGGGGWVSDMFSGPDPSPGSIPCPVCIGYHYASEGVDLLRYAESIREYGGDPEELEELENELDEKVRKREVELGYRT